ncbi:651_t:CDS:2, partial [Acaulospora colombiana]
GDSFTPMHYYAFNAFLAALQVLMCIWFFSILRVAWSVVRGKPAEDVRSDEDDVEEDEYMQDKKQK